MNTPNARCPVCSTTYVHPGVSLSVPVTYADGLLRAACRTAGHTAAQVRAAWVRDGSPRCGDLPLALR